MLWTNLKKLVMEKPIGFGDRPALLVVDFQKGFTDAASPLGRSSHVQRAVDNTVTLIGEARRRGIPIASCNVAWQSRDDMAYWKIASLYDGSFFHGHPHIDIDPRISDPDYIFEFTKNAIYFLPDPYPCLAYKALHRYYYHYRVYHIGLRSGINCRQLFLWLSHRCA